MNIHGSFAITGLKIYILANATPGVIAGLRIEWEYMDMICPGYLRDCCAVFTGCSKAQRGNTTSNTTTIT